MAGLFVLVIIIGCGVYQYLKGSLVKSFATLIITICAAIIAFSHFEPFAAVIIKKAGADHMTIGAWAASVAFLMLFLFSFAIFLELTNRLAKEKIDLGGLTEHIGKPICGILLGFVLSGVILTAAAMAPLPGGFPYRRFEKTNPDPQAPDKPLLNADGFAAGWFTMVSKGSFSGKKSFAALHPNFLDQLFLNRHNSKNNIPTITTRPVIEIPAQKALWPAPKELKNFDDPNQTIQQKSGVELTIVRLGLKTASIRYTGAFSLSQLRLICKRKSDIKNPFAGCAKNIFPVGYMQAENMLQKKKLGEKIRLSVEDFGPEGLKWMDLAFYVPDNYTAVLLEFKQNDLVKLPALTAAEQAPETIPFTLPTQTEEDANEPNTPADDDSELLQPPTQPPAQEDSNL